MGRSWLHWCPRCGLGFREASDLDAHACEKRQKRHPELHVDLEAERRVLGGVIAYPTTLHRLAPLEPSDFSRTSHGAIHSAMIALRRQGEAITVATLAHELEARGELERIGGEEYLSKLVELAPHRPDDVRVAAARVVELSRRRHSGALLVMRRAG